MSLKINGTTVINDSRALENISNLKTVGGQAILGTGDIPFPSSAPSSHVGATGTAHGVATTTVAGFMSSADKTKLDGIATGATAYTHPSNHPASIITQDTNNRFVTDAEKTSWNAKVDASSVQTLTNKTISGGVYSGVVDVGGSVQTNVITVPALDINCSLGNYFVKTINANSTFTFSNTPASKAYSFIIEIQHQSGTITWPSSVKWPYNRLPTLTTNRTHIFSFITYNGGQSWRGSCNPDYLN